MSRRANAKPAGIQMFPFLAVLICTMGALVVLLHAFARHGQVQAIEIAKARAAAGEINADDFQWRIGHLRTARAKTQAELAGERLKLAHVEDHQRRLLKKLRELKLAAAEIEHAGAENSGQSHATADELAATKAQLEEARAAVDAARRQGRQKRVSYSIVPYNGRNMTHRRPIYIECRKNLIVLQPEGIDLTPRDFVGSFAPGNPLAAALRAQREYFARQAPNGKLADEPYPLMLVRPDGVAAYYAARAALDSWGSEIGYELIGSDWVLKLPEPDPQLAALTRQVVSEARLRHREYIRTSPQMAKRRSRPVYRARSHGGFAREGGPGGGLGDGGTGGWDDFAGDWAGGGDSHVGDDRYGSAARRGDLSPHGNSTLTDPYGDGDGGWADAGASGGSRDNPRQEGDEHALGRPGGTESGRDAGARDGGNAHSTTDAGGGLHSTNPARGNPAGDAPPQADEPAFTQPQSAGAGSSQGSSSSHSSSHTPNASAHQPRSIASTRGHDWGLPESSPGAVAATRPILIDCYPDRLVIAPESRGEAPKEIRLQAQTRDSMDELTSAVWEHMQAWGKAGRGLYWRPALAINVQRGAAGRYADIEALLADSGLDVERRPPRAAPRPGSRPPSGPVARPPVRPY